MQFQKPFPLKLMRDNSDFFRPCFTKFIKGEKGEKEVLIGVEGMGFCCYFCCCGGERGGEEGEEVVGCGEVEVGLRF